MQITNKQDNILVFAIEENETILISDEQGNKVKIFFPDASIWSCYRRIPSKPMQIDVS